MDCLRELRLCHSMHPIAHEWQIISSQLRSGEIEKPLGERRRLTFRKRFQRATGGTQGRRRSRRGANGRRCSRLYHPRLEITRHVADIYAYMQSLPGPQQAKDIAILND
jgi:hypothetical protein